MDSRAVIASVLHELGVPDPALSLIVSHARAVDRDADRLGLLSDRGLDAVLLRHSADSLLFALARRPVPGEVWLDAGSGAGFPGLVLACAFPATAFLLVEPQQRRAGFLDLQSVDLGLGNVSIRREPVGDLEPGIADVVVARALDRPAETWPDLRKPLRDDGVVLVAAGARQEMPAGALALEVGRPFVDSPGRVFMMRAR